jgi:hypothetical protein
MEQGKVIFKVSNQQEEGMFVHQLSNGDKIKAFCKDPFEFRALLIFTGVIDP